MLGFGQVLGSVGHSKQSEEWTVPDICTEAKYL